MALRVAKRPNEVYTLQQALERHCGLIESFLFPWATILLLCI